MFGFRGSGVSLPVPAVAENKGIIAYSILTRSGTNVEADKEHLDRRIAYTGTMGWRQKLNRPAHEVAVGIWLARLGG